MLLATVDANQTDYESGISVPIKITIFRDVPSNKLISKWLNSAVLNVSYAVLLYKKSEMKARLQ